MSELRYSTAALNGDLIRAGIGFALCVTPLLLVSLAPWLFFLLAAPAGLFEPGHAPPVVVEGEVQAPNEGVLRPLARGHR